MYIEILNNNQEDREFILPRNGTVEISQDNETNSNDAHSNSNLDNSDSFEDAISNQNSNHNISNDSNSNEVIDVNDISMILDNVNVNINDSNDNELRTRSGRIINAPNKLTM